MIFLFIGLQSWEEIIEEKSKQKFQQKLKHMG